jgi:hypothetical protein
MNNDSKLPSGWVKVEGLEHVEKGHVGLPGLVEAYTDTDGLLLLGTETPFSFQELQGIIAQHWPGVSMENIRIWAKSEKMRGCYCHDNISDWDNFIVIERMGE